MDDVRTKPNTVFKALAMSCVGFKHKCNKDFKGHVCKECQERWRDGKPVTPETLLATLHCNIADQSKNTPVHVFIVFILFLTDGQIRVVRSNKAKEYGPQSKTKLYRYDGLYKVADYWTEKGKSGKDPPPHQWDHHLMAALTKTHTRTHTTHHRTRHNRFQCVPVSPAPRRPRPSPVDGGRQGVH
jgi:hypothetical protein